MFHVFTSQEVNEILVTGISGSILPLLLRHSNADDNGVPCVSGDFFDDFESGSVSPPWMLYGDDDWFADSVNAIEGNHSMKSPDFSLSVGKEIFGAFVELQFCSDFPGGTFSAHTRVSDWCSNWNQFQISVFPADVEGSYNSTYLVLYFPPGPGAVTFLFGLNTTAEQETCNTTGRVLIDLVEIVSNTDSPSASPSTTALPTLSSTSVPSIRPSSSPSPTTASPSTESPTTASPTTPSPTTETPTTSSPSTFQPTIRDTSADVPLNGTFDVWIIRNHFNLSDTDLEELSNVTFAYLFDNIGGPNRFYPTAVAVENFELTSNGGNVTTIALRFLVNYIAKQSFLDWLDDGQQDDIIDAIEVNSGGQRRHLQNNQCTGLDKALCCSNNAINQENSRSAYCQERGCNSNRCTKRRNPNANSIIYMNHTVAAIDDNLFGLDYFDVLGTYTSNFATPGGRAVLGALDLVGVGFCGAMRYAFEVFGEPFPCDVFWNNRCRENEDRLFGENEFCTSSHPSVGPSITPSSIPINQPSTQPSVSNLPSTTDVPSMMPSASDHPSSMPSGFPSMVPMTTLSMPPSAQPSATLSMLPSESQIPSITPSIASSIMPSASGKPSKQPSISPSETPSSNPTDNPSTYPSENPSEQPVSGSPSMLPSGSQSPSRNLSTVPTSTPSVSVEPSDQSSKRPSESPSTIPTSVFPSGEPSMEPSRKPSYIIPSSSPTTMISMAPSVFPSIRPSEIPTRSKNPSNIPTSTIMPSDSSAPTSAQIRTPSVIPSAIPSEAPSKSPPSSSRPSTSPTFNPPIAVDDDVTVFLNEPAIVDVLSNDVSNLELFVTEITEGLQAMKQHRGSGEEIRRKRKMQQAESGVCQVSEDNKFVRYTPNDGFLGLDSCGYRVCDSRGDNCKFFPMVISSCQQIGSR
ncbi:hypothetical protein ACHAXS_004794 [Conticribra weissflogii]